MALTKEDKAWFCKLAAAVIRSIGYATTSQYTRMAFNEAAKRVENGDLSIEA